MATLAEQYEALRPKEVNPYTPEFLGKAGTNLAETPGLYIDPRSKTRYVDMIANYGGFVNDDKPTLVNLLGSKPTAHEHAHVQQNLAFGTDGEYPKGTSGLHTDAYAAVKHGAKYLGRDVPLNSHRNTHESMAELQALEGRLKAGQTIWDIPGMDKALIHGKKRMIDQYLYPTVPKYLSPESFQSTEQPKAEQPTRNYLEQFQQWVRNKTK